MAKFLKLMCQPIVHIKPIYYIWSKPQTQILDDRRKEDYTNQPAKIAIDEVVQNSDTSRPGQRHVEQLATELNDTSDNKTSAISNPDETEKHISFLYKKEENTVDVIQSKLLSSFRKYCPSPHDKFNKRVSSKETRLKKSKTYKTGSWCSMLPFNPCYILLELWCKVSGSQNAKILAYKKKEKPVDGIQPKLSSISRKYCSCQQVKFDICVCLKETRLKLSHSNFIGSWCSIIHLSPCFILLVLCCNVSGNQSIKMSLSIPHAQAIFNEPFTVLCHIKNATACAQLTFLQGKFGNKDSWKVLAKRDTKYTDFVLPSVYHSQNGITYNLTLLQLQPVDVGAGYRCECDAYNNVSKRLIQIDDGLTVNPEKTISKFRIINMMINFTIGIWNVYPEPENYTLTILSDNHRQVVSYNRTHRTATTVPYLLNATYSGFFQTPFKLCNPNITVKFHFDDRSISTHYTTSVCDDLGKKSEDMTTPWKNISIIVTTLCACLLIVLSFVAATCAKRIWTKRRKHINDIAEVIYLDEIEQLPIHIV